MSLDPRPFTVALIQMRCSTDSDDNLGRACTMLARPQPASTDRLPSENSFAPSILPVGGCSTFDLAEPIPGPTHQCTSSLAKETRMVIVGSIFERRAAGLYYNTAVVIDSDGSLLGRYRKLHIPDDPLYYEKYYFTPGDLGFQVFDTSCARVGTLVCWDQWYPEAARLTALKGAEILFYPTAIGWHPAEKARFGADQASAWETIQRAHAIANGVYVAAVNRTGHEGPTDGGLEFWGKSFVADPFGRIIAKASDYTEEVLIAKCDPRLQEETRRNWPFLRDRRIDTYGPITERFLD